MNLNKWLCKHCDANRKGYVTINDVGIKLFDALMVGAIYSLFAMVIFSVLCGMYLLTFGKLDVGNFNLIDDLTALLGGIGYLIATILYVIGMDEFIFTPLSKVKIVKTPLPRLSSKHR